MHHHFCVERPRHRFTDGVTLSFIGGYGEGTAVFLLSRLHKLFLGLTLHQLFQILLQLFVKETISIREGKWLNREGDFLFREGEIFFCEGEFRFVKV